MAGEDVLLAAHTLVVVFTTCPSAVDSKESYNIPHTNVVILQSQFTLTSALRQDQRHRAEEDEMPVIAHRQPRQGSAAWRNSYSSYSSNGSGRDTQLWIVQENGDHHRQKTMDFPAPRKPALPLGQRQKRPLRVDTYSKLDLHDRYLSSEEEVSPSPHENFDAAADVEADTDPNTIDITFLEADVMIGIAIVVNMMNVGKPKFIDIPRLAPMHKRRSNDPTKISLRHRQGSVTSCYSTKSTTSSKAVKPITEPAETFMPEEATFQPELDSPPLPPIHLPTLPEADLAIAHEASMLEFPGLDIRPTPSYRDYDPYLLNPPRLYAQSQRSRLCVNAGPGVAWKGGLSRYGRGRGAMKSKKLVRRANERSSMVGVSASPLQDGDSAKRMVIA